MVGYDPIAEETITVTNTGNKAITLAQPTAADYTVGMLSQTNLEPAGAATFTVTPKVGLAAGTYHETVYISGSDGVSATVDVNFTVAEPVIYGFLSGDGGMYHQEGPTGLSFTANGLFSKFTGVILDGNPVDPSQYDATAGSTVITFHTDFLDTLSIGEHVLRVEFTDGYAEADFTIAREQDPDMPDTGDNDALVLYGALALLSLAALAVLGRRRVRR